MIHSIHALGEHATMAEATDDKLRLSTLCQNPAKSDAYKYVITIEVRDTDGVITFERVGVEEFSGTSEKILRYLYRRGTSSGTDITLTTRITDPKKTFGGKILNWCKQDFSDPLLDLTADEQHFVIQVCTCLQDHRDEILSQIIDHYEPLKKQKVYAILTVTIEDAIGRHYLGDIEAFKKILSRKTIAGFYQKYETESRAAGQICSVCRKSVPEVYGFVNTYAFYTVDKPGMVSGGFDRAQAWKNYPVCRECALALEDGKKYLEAHASFQFYDFDYYLIPKPIRGEIDPDILEVLEGLHSDGEEQKITGYHMRLLDDTRDEILELLSQQENSFTCTILVYRGGHSEFKILLAIEDVFPSRLKTLFDAKRAVDRLPHLRGCQVPANRFNPKEGKKSLEFTFENIWTFFGKNTDTRTYFLDIVNRIFSGLPISSSFVYWGICQRLRKQFAQGYSTKEIAIRGLSLLLYLEKLGILRTPRGITMTQTQLTIPVDRPTPSRAATTAEELFVEFSPFFNDDARRAVFLVGALTQLLLDVQYNDWKATPFRTKLQGLRLDQRRVQRLFPDVQNKFEEYKKNYYRDLEELASRYMVQAGDVWPLTKDEISFLFVVGMNHAHLFKREKSDTNGKNEINIDESNANGETETNGDTSL